MTGTRGGLGRIVAMAIGLAVLLLLAAAGKAHGGVYGAVQCGWGVGAELDPTYPASEGTAFSLNTSACVPPPGISAAGMKFEAGVAPAGAFGLARARWVAPPGTSFRGVHLTWSGEPQWGNYQLLGFDVGDQFKILAASSESNTSPTPTPVDLAIEGQAWAFEGSLQCLYSQPIDFPCVRSTVSTMRLGDLTFTLEDGQAPEARLGGTATAPGWRRGTTTLELGAGDVGAGIAGEEATIDGAPALAEAPACAAATIEGRRLATKLQPCPGNAARAVEVDTTRLADGAYTVRGCATDFSGGQGCAPEATLRVDNSPPAISFADAAEGEVAATVSDRYSGPAAGTIALRRAGADSWTDLPTTFDREGDGEATLSARLPELSAGVYLFRAVATDTAGNSGSAQLRAAGSAAEVRRQAADGHGGNGAGGAGPARRRRVTHLTARLTASGHGGSGLTVDYGTAVEVRGRLTDARGAGIGGRPIAIVVRAAAGAGGPERRRALTDGGGRFAARLAPGTSRRVRVAFPGGGGFAPARPRALALRVRAAVTLTADPTELHTGASVHLRGRVRLGPARVSRRGKLIAIQYLEQATRRWRPALVVRTDAKGRFDTSYRFRYVTGVDRIRLRATAPAEGGWPFARGSSSPVTVTVRGG